eukprot:9057718-Pyramimonas_sp.AAC.1
MGVAWYASSALRCALPQDAAGCRYRNKLVDPRDVLSGRLHPSLTGKRVVARISRHADTCRSATPFSSNVRCASGSQKSTGQSTTEASPFEGDPEGLSFAEKLRFWNSGSKNTQPRSSSSTDGRKYVIQNGDTLWLIANKHGLTVKQLVGLNPSVETNVNMIKVYVRRLTPLLLTESSCFLPSSDSHRRILWLVANCTSTYISRSSENLLETFGEQNDLCVSIFSFIIFAFCNGQLKNELPHNLRQGHGALERSRVASE